MILVVIGGASTRVEKSELDDWFFKKFFDSHSGTMKKSVHLNWVLHRAAGLLVFAIEQVIKMLVKKFQGCFANFFGMEPCLHHLDAQTVSDLIGRNRPFEHIEDYLLQRDKQRLIVYIISITHLPFDEYFQRRMWNGNASVVMV